MPKGEIAHYEQFLLLPQCFQKSSAVEMSESVYMWERVNPSVVPTYYPDVMVFLQIFFLQKEELLYPQKIKFWGGI